MSIRKRQRRPRMCAWQLVLVLLALLASSAQQLVAQTHWHAAVAVAVADADTASPAPDQRPVNDDCLWCQIAVQASAAIPSGTVLGFVFVEAVTVPISLQLALNFRVQPAHAWQSRGPPPV